MKLVVVYITARSPAEAHKIGSALVRERLAACVNILGPMESCYRWKGKIQKDREVALIAKTRRALVPALTRRVKALHSYEVPCVVAVEIVGGNRGFLEWVGRETRPVL